MATTTSETRDHDAPNTGKTCWCGRYHYQCQDCGADCTVGTPAAPGVLRGDRQRCYECDGLYERKRNAMSPWSPAEIETIRIALTQIADDGDAALITPEARKLATTILCRAENYRG